MTLDELGTALLSRLDQIISLLTPTGAPGMLELPTITTTGTPQG